MQGFLNFLVKVITNPHKNDFMVRLGAGLILSRYGITGPLALFLGYFLRCFIGLMVGSGVYVIDIALDAYKEGEKMEEFKLEAREAYAKATAKIYTEEEKVAIREQYKKLIEKFAPVGKPKHN